MVSFADLPYGLQRRLDELSLVDFEETGRLPFELSRRLRKPFKQVKDLNTTDTKLLIQNKVVRVGDTLNLRIKCPHKYQTTVSLVRGYPTLKISGRYTWQLFLAFIRPTVKEVDMAPGMKIPRKEFDTFVKKLFTIMSDQSLSIDVDGTWLAKKLPKLKSMALDFMHQRRIDGLNVSYIRVNVELAFITSFVIER